MISLVSNTNKLSISEAGNEIERAIKAYYVKDEAGNYYYDPVNRLPFYLEGPPGIGKTEIVKQIADRLGIGFVSFSVTHHTRNSMIGLPVIETLENGEKYTEYTMSEVIASVIREQEKGHKEGVLLLDEFNCASETIMPIMLAFLQTRNIGLYRLPDEWVIVLCGNPPEYNTSAKNFSPAIMDRVRRIDVEMDAEDFLRYAEEKKYNKLVVDYLKLNPSSIYSVIPAKGKSETVTSRGWENLSRTLDAYEKCGEKLSLNTVSQFIKSQAISTDFWKYYWLHRNSFTEKEMLRVIEGTYDDDMVKVFSENEREFMDSALDLIEKGLVRAAVSESPKKVSAKISNTFSFLEKLDNNISLIDKLFFFVTGNAALCDIVRRVKNESYLENARRMYGIES